MIKLLYDEFVTIYYHHNIFRKYGHWWFFACLFKCSLFNIFVYGSLICIYLMNTLVNWLIPRFQWWLSECQKLVEITDSVKWIANPRHSDFGNSPDKLRHTRSAAYSVELVLNKYKASDLGWWSLSGLLLGFLRWCRNVQWHFGTSSEMSWVRSALGPKCPYTGLPDKQRYDVQPKTEHLILQFVKWSKWYQRRINCNSFFHFSAVWRYTNNKNCETTLL